MISGFGQIFRIWTGINDLGQFSMIWTGIRSLYLFSAILSGFTKFRLVGTWLLVTVNELIGTLKRGWKV